MNQYDSSAEGFRLRQEFKGAFEDDMFDDEQPEVLKDTIAVLKNVGVTYGDFQLVGHGEKTNDYCGKRVTYRGCLRVELHDRIASDGVNHKGKVFVRRVRFSCGKPSCPVCYKGGWAPRQAGKIERRLAEASKRFGLVEHIVVCIPSKFWHLSYEHLRKMAFTALRVRGVWGGCIIWHGFRLDKEKWVWYWSPHFHVLGFIQGGYGKCRGCCKCFKGCDGFVDRNFRWNEKDGFYVKVLGKRKTVGGTAWYQLNHSSIRVDGKRFHVVTWFGVCSYRKLKVTVEKRKSLCPICLHDLEKIRYNGNRFVVNEHLSSGEREFFDDAIDECGFPNWVLNVGARYGG